VVMPQPEKSIDVALGQWSRPGWVTPLALSSA